MIEIPLTQGQVALVDNCDYQTVAPFKWCAHNKRRKTFYAVGTESIGDGTFRTIKMHRVILGVTDPAVWVDHIDGNGLNNCRSNLRICTRGQNQRNRPANRNNKSGYKGVFACKRSGRWIAKIMCDRKAIHIGRFDTPEDAHAAYVQAAQSLHKEFSKS